MSQEVDEFGLQHAIISRNPRILLVALGAGGGTGFKIFSDGTTSLDYLCEIVGPGGHLIMSPWWFISDVPEWEEILQALINATSRTPSVRAHFFCNAQSEVELLSKKGFTAIQLNQNAFTNEKIFHVSAIAKEFDAIYNAKMNTFKRHELASEVPRLALIYSRYGDPEYYPRIKSILSNATFLNGDPASPNYKMFNPGQVRDTLNRAHVGLCLSRIEGAMYASMEYLLCGLPVVSTESVGGRDAFFDDRFCKIVADNPSDVALAVSSLIEKKLDPHFVRNETLKKLEIHREKFTNYIDALQREGGFKPNGKDAFFQIMDGPWSCWTYDWIAGIRRKFDDFS